MYSRILTPKIIVQNLMFRQQVLLPSSEKEQYNSYTVLSLMKAVLSSSYTVLSLMKAATLAAETSGFVQ